MTVTYGWIKLHKKIIDSSIMETSVATRFFFVLALAYSDTQGQFRGTVKTLARHFNMSKEQVSDALAELQQPDPESQNKEHGGRRIVQIGVQDYLIVGKKAYNPDPTSPDRQRRYKQRKQEVTVPSVTDTLVTTEEEEEEEEDKSTQQRHLYQPDFEDWWRFYPRRVQKGQAERAWKRLLQGEKDTCMVITPRFAAIWADAPTDRQMYCPYPATWLNARGWEDDLEEVKKSAGIVESVWEKQAREEAAKESRLASARQEAWAKVSTERAWEKK